jgi:hypothetical protein
MEVVGNLNNTIDELKNVGLSSIAFEAGLLMLIPASIPLVIKYFLPSLLSGYIFFGYIVIMVLIAFLARPDKSKKEADSKGEG